MNIGVSPDPMTRCPHCGALSRIEGNGANAACGVCGGPRIVGDYGGETALAALREEKKLRSQARISSFATIVQGIFATIATLIGIAIFPAALVGKLIVLAVAITPTILALRSRSRASGARKRADEAHQRALGAAAEEIAKSAKGGITAGELAKKLGVEGELAEQLLTSLTVHDRTRIDVGDDAEVRYSVAPEEKRTRVDAEEPVEDELAAFDAKLQAAARGTK